MPNLTQSRAQKIWDEAFEKVRIDVDGSWACFRVAGKLHGHNYYVDTARDGIDCTESTTLTELETLVVAHLQTVEYKGQKTVVTSIDI